MDVDWIHGSWQGPGSTSEREGRDMEGLMMDTRSGMSYIHILTVISKFYYRYQQVDIRR